MEILDDQREEAGLWIFPDFEGNLPFATAPTVDIL